MNDKTSCSKCGATILPSTADHTGGLCMPCEKCAHKTKKIFGKWVITYSIFSLLSAIIGYAIETHGKMPDDWLGVLVLLPFINLLSFFTIGKFYESFTLFVLAIGSVILVGSSIGFAIKRKNHWLYGVAIGSILINWKSITIGLGFSV